MGSKEQILLTPEIHSRTQYGSENMNNSIKEEPATGPSTPVEHAEQAPASELPAVEGTSSNQIVNKDDLEDQVTPIRPSKVSVVTRRKRRDTGIDATVVDSPDWLPKGWITELKFRESGSTAGTKDKYYFDPLSGHRFRSKPDVLRYLHSGEITKCKPKPRLLGSGNNESQPVSLQSPDALNLQKLDINSSSGVSSNLKFETNLGCDPTCAKKDGDESTCPQIREASLPMSNGFKGEVSQLPEATVAALQDVLPEEHNEKESMNSECTMNMKRKQHPALDGQRSDEVKECSSQDLQHINMSKILKPDDSGNKVKRRKQNGHLTGTTSPMAVKSNEIRDGPVQRPIEASLAFPSTPFAQGQPSNQEQNICSLRNSVKHNGTDSFIITMKVALVSNTGQKSAINKPSETSILPMQGQPSEPRLVPPIHNGNLKSNHQPSCLDMLVENSMVNIGSYSAIPGSCKVVPIPNPSSPCSVLHAKQPLKSRKGTRNLKVNPQEMKRHLVALGRKLCRKVIKQNPRMSKTSAQPIN